MSDILYEGNLTSYNGLHVASVIKMRKAGHACEPICYIETGDLVYAKRWLKAQLKKLKSVDPKTVSCIRNDIKNRRTHDKNTNKTVDSVPDN